VTEAQLLHACTVARAAWPAIEIDEARFRAYASEHMAEGSDAELRWADLWLACACVEGNPAAIAALESWGFPSVDAALARLRLPEHDQHEIKQLLRARLLLPDGERGPRLADYSGRGDLRGYLRISATRLALNFVRNGGRELPSGDELPDVIVEPELRELADRYRVACEAALARAIEELGQRERNLLRQHLIDGVTMQRLAVQYGAHRVTIARWLEDARTQVLERVKAHLAEQHGIGDEDLPSVLRLVRSQLDVSLPRRLGAG
jgi:RNA polymerase sigma-70 factor (ECF subfamily)